RLEESRIAGSFVDRSEPVDGPGQAARPAGIAAVTLLRRLTQELASVEIKDALVRRASVAAYESLLRREAVLESDFEQCFVAGLLCGVNDDADVGHDVDEDRLGSHERAEVFAFFFEPLSQGLSGLDDNGI